MWFDPHTGSIADHGATFHTLAAAVLLDLAVQGRVEITDRSPWWVTDRLRRWPGLPRPRTRARRLERTPAVRAGSTV